jgi:hypothetical protein
VCIGVFLSSILAIPFFGISGNEFGITLAGMGAGGLFVLAALFSFLAIPEIGLAIGQGVWGGSAVLVSFLWGAIGPAGVGGVIKSNGGSVGAVILLMLGIFGIIYSQTLSLTNNYIPETDADKPLLVNHNGAKRQRKSLGFLFATLVGSFGGCVFVSLNI